MNALDKILSMIGISSERFEKMSEAEQANLTQISETHAGLEQERDLAVSNLEAANNRITELEDELTEAQNLATQAGNIAEESTNALTEATATISELQAQVTQLNDKLAKTPSAGITPIVANTSEGEHAPGKPTKEEPKKYWTSADQELVDFHSKFSK